MKEIMAQINKSVGVILLLLFVGFSTVLWAADGMSQPNNLLQAVKASRLSNNRLQLTFTFSQAVANPKVFSIKKPPRVVLDFQDVQNGLGQRSLVFNESPLHSVAAVYSHGRTRVVLDLQRAVQYEVSRGNKSIVVVLTPVSAPLTVPSSTTSTKKSLSISKKPAKTEPLTPNSQVREIDFHKEASGGAQVVTRLTDDDLGVDVRQRGDDIYVLFLHTHIPLRLARRLDVTDFATPVQTIETRQRGDNVEMIIKNTAQFRYLAYQVNDRFIVDVKYVSKNSGHKKPKPRYVGERLSLNFQDIKVRAVLQLLADFTGINIVASDTVDGAITLRLNNVPWDQALDIVLKTQGLAKRNIGDVLLIAPADEIAKREKEELEAEKEVSDLEPIQSELIQLNYAKATAMANLLKDENNSLLSERGNVRVDARTNVLWVQDTEGKLKEIRHLIHGLDIPVRQVLIEARIVNVDTRYEEELGIRFGITRETHHTGTLAGANELAGGTSASGTTVDPDTLVPNNRLNVNLPAISSTVAQVPSLGIALARLGKNFLLDLELSAIEVEGGGELISSPRLVTVNQQEASIEAGEEIPFQQATSSGATAVEFKKAVLALRVTPQITPDNKIIMEIKVNQDRRSNEPLVLGTPAIDTQQIETQVLVDNGETIVLGGIFKQNDAKTVERVPFLGDLPIIGNFFRSKKKEYKREELLIFITPKIVEQTIAVTTR